MDGSTARSETLGMDADHWTVADRSSSYPKHLGMELLKMVPSLPYDGPFLGKNHLLWITGAWGIILEVCLFLLNAILSAGSVCCGLSEMTRKRGISHRPYSQESNNVVGMEKRVTEFGSNRNYLDLAQCTAVGPCLLPHYIPPGDWSMAKVKLPVGRDCQMDTQLEKQSEIAFICTNPLILPMIRPGTEEYTRSLDREDDQLPSDRLCDSEENMDDAESSDWSTDDDDSCDESDSGQLWDSFFQDDPYNPLNFSASTGHRDLACKTETDDEEDSSLGHFESENDKLWDSFFQNTDPFNPLNFTACTTSCVASNRGVKEGVCSIEPSEERPPETCGLCFNTNHCDDVGQPASTLKQETSENQRKTVKKVQFCSEVEVHKMIVWDFAYRAARKGPWEQYARDRSRFQRRIAETEAAIGFCLDEGHRRAVWAKLSGN